MPTARAPGRVTIIGDHTDYNGGLSLPMAIELATEVAFTPKPGSFLVGIDSDQFPGRPVEIMLGDTAPGPRRGRPGGRGSCGCSRRRAAGSARVTSTIPVGAGLSSSAAFSVALLLALGHDPDPWRWPGTARRPSAAPGAHVGLLDPLAIAGATAGHALLIDFDTLRDPPGRRARGGRFRASCTARRPASSPTRPTPTGAPSASGPRTSSGRPLGLCELGDLSALSDPVLRRRARHVITECARVREAERLLARGNLSGLGAVMTEGHRSLADDYRVSVPAVDELVEHLLGSARRARCPHERRRLRRVRHRAVPARLAGARPRDPCPRRSWRVSPVAGAARLGT